MKCFEMDIDPTTPGLEIFLGKRMAIPA